MPCSVPRRIQNVMVFAVIVLESEDEIASKMLV